MSQSQNISIYLNEIQINKCIQILKEEFYPIVIYLFGSAARNELREDSDIDISFLTKTHTRVL